MGLADLKKSSTQSNSAKSRPLEISLDAFIDDFIDDATMYAAGQMKLDPAKADIIDLASRFIVPDSTPIIDNQLLENQVLGNQIPNKECHQQAQLQPDLFSEAALVHTAIASETMASEPIAQKPILKISKGDEPFRKATFTLSESAISHLAEIASGCDVAKSKLIRFLIEHHYSLSIEERKQKESAIIVD